MVVQYNLSGIAGMIEDAVTGRLPAEHPFVAAHKAPLIGAVKIACSDKKRQNINSAPKVFKVKPTSAFMHKDYHQVAEFILGSIQSISEINPSSQYVLSTQSDAVVKQYVFQVFLEESPTGFTDFEPLGWSPRMLR
jgi:hypothetical protein